MKENSIEREEILNNIKAYMQESIDRGYHKFVYNDLGYDEKCVNVINAIEHILSDYKRVLKENRILKEEKEQAWEEWNNLEQGSYETELKLKEENRKLKKQVQRQINEWNKDIKSNYISKHKVKDKIEELKAQYKTALEENSTEAFILKCQITILQELIEEREER